MSIEVPFFPFEFNWQLVKGVLDEWFSRLLRSGDLNPTGAIVEFAGTEAPEGWLECNGAEYEIDRFPNLAAIIGVESSPGNFEVPDATATPPTVGQIWIIKA